MLSIVTEQAAASVDYVPASLLRMVPIREALQKPAASDRDIICTGTDWCAWVGGMKQLTLATVGFERYAKTTRRAAFLAWSGLCPGRRCAR